MRFSNNLVSLGITFKLRDSTPSHWLSNLSTTWSCPKQSSGDETIGACRFLSSRFHLQPQQISDLCELSLGLVMCSNMMLTTCRATCSNIIYSKPRQTCKGLECFGSTTPTNFSKEAFSKGPEDLCIAQSPKHCQADDLRLDALDASLEMFIRAILNGILSLKWHSFFILCTLYVSCLLRFGMSWFLHPGLCVCGLTNDKITSTLLILGYIYNIYI